MKYYTVQKLSAWLDANNKGYLTGNEEYIDKEWFLKSYKWMMKQMTKRLINYNNEFPIWLWLDISNISFSELLNDEWVLLEIELDDEHVLLSNFLAWHHVLNDCSLDDDCQITKEQSWEYIFNEHDLEKFGYGFEDEDLQGTIGKIDCDHIKVIKYLLNNC